MVKRNATNAAGCVVVGLVLWAGGHAEAASTVPFLHEFDDGEGISLNGVRGWSTTGDGSATISNEQARLQDITLSNAFTPAENAVTISFDLQPVFSESAGLPPGSRFGFFVNTNGLVTAYDGGAKTNLTHTPLSESTNAAFQVRVDYPLQSWSLWVNGVKVATDLALSSTGPDSLFEELGFIEGSTNAFSYVDNVSVQRATTASTSLLPFRERFDSLADGDLNGQRDWVSSNAVVQSAVVYSGSKAGSITSRTGWIEHTFVDGQTNVWTDVRIRPLRGPAPLPPPGSTFAFYVNGDGRVVAYDGATRTVLSNTSVGAGSWVRFSTYSDYANTNWDLYVNGGLVAEDLQFYDQTATAFTAYGITGADSNTAAYVDNIYVGTRPAVSDGWLLLVR